MQHIGFYKVSMCVLFRFSSPKCNGCLLPFTPAKNIGKTLNPIMAPFKFESTLHTLDLKVAQFPSASENIIQMRNTYLSEVGSMNTNFENNQKNPKIMKCTIAVPKQCNFHPKKKKKTITNQFKSFKTSFVVLKKN